MRTPCDASPRRETIIVSFKLRYMREQSVAALVARLIWVWQHPGAMQTFDHQWRQDHLYFASRLDKDVVLSLWRRALSAARVLAKDVDEEREIELNHEPQQIQPPPSGRPGSSLQVSAPKRSAKRTATRLAPSTKMFRGRGWLSLKSSWMTQAQAAPSCSTRWNSPSRERPSRQQETTILFSLLTSSCSNARASCRSEPEAKP